MTGNVPSDGGASGPVEAPEDVVERISTLCPALPEVAVRVDPSRTRTRSRARSFDIRRRSFCLLVAVEDPSGKLGPLLVLRAQAEEREALLSSGHPYLTPRAGGDRIGVLLTDGTDWPEIREFVTESYRSWPRRSSSRRSMRQGRVEEIRAREGSRASIGPLRLTE
jgi:hypothetical protein